MRRRMPPQRPWTPGFGFRIIDWCDTITSARFGWGPLAPPEGRCIVNRSFIEETITIAKAGFLAQGDRLAAFPSSFADSGALRRTVALWSGTPSQWRDRSRLPHRGGPRDSRLLRFHESEHLRAAS